MEKWSFQRTRELMTPRALRGMAVNEVGRARISMMVRSMSSNSRPDTLVQGRSPQPHGFLLQRTAGPYIGVKRFQTIHRSVLRCHSRARASLRNRHQSPSTMGFEDEAEQSLPRPCRQPSSRSKRTCELTSSIVPRGTSFHRSVELEFPPIGCDPARFSCCCGLFPGPAEFGAVNPDAVHDHG